MVSQVAVEAQFSATYVEHYLDSVEHLPDDLQRHLTRIRELDVNYGGANLVSWLSLTLRTTGERRKMHAACPTFRDARPVERFLFVERASFLVFAKSGQTHSIYPYLHDFFFQFCKNVTLFVDRVRRKLIAWTRNVEPPVKKSWT